MVGATSSEGFLCIIFVIIVIIIVIVVTTVVFVFIYSHLLTFYSIPRPKCFDEHSLRHGCLYGLPMKVVHNSLSLSTVNFYSAHNARIASALLATAIPSVRPSVRLSHAGIVSKRRHVARCSLHRWIAKYVRV